MYCFHILYELVEEVSTIVRTCGGFWVILNREYRCILQSNTGQGTIIEVDVAYDNVFAAFRVLSIYNKTMILRSYFTFPRE